ncbi:MAG: hypothetical protein LBJ67_05145 [Planctomycetaceae bacterium]|jgi:hypothetical protein|nr:hypothetical protein [Planctomycetaceae bacterium]
MKFAAIFLSPICRFFWILGILCLFGGGCATSYVDRVQLSRKKFYAGNLDSSRKEMEHQLKWGRRKEADLVKLETAVMDMSNGKMREAKTALREVRDRFDDNERKKLVGNTLSLWTDDTVVSYSGEDYEKVMIRMMLTVADLLDNGGDAEAYSLQVIEKQEQIRQNANKKPLRDKDDNELPNPKLAYKQVAFGEYLRGVLREETLTNYDDAERAYQHVVSWEPKFSQGKTDLLRVQQGQHHQQGNGVVYVVAFVGRGPYKAQVNAEATQIALLIADRVFSMMNKYSVPPTLAPVPIPEIRRYYDNIHAVGIYADGKPVSATETITDVGQMAIDQFNANRDMIIAKTIIRRVVKKGTVYAAKEVADVNPWVSLLMDVGGVVWEAYEAADTRCWGLLPDRIQVARLELPAGEHTLELQSISEQGKPLSSQKYPVTIHVANGYNSYILANFPQNELVGKISINERE